MKGDGNSINISAGCMILGWVVFFAIDLLAPLYAWNSPYAFIENQVIHAVEMEGREKDNPEKPGGCQTPKLDNESPEDPIMLTLSPNDTYKLSIPPIT